MTSPDPGAALLTLVQWLSPAFPLGGFAYSHGLETAMATGAVTSEADLASWLTVLLQEGSARNDAILLSLVLQGADPEEIDALARAMAAAPERLEEARAQGAAFLAVTNGQLGTDWADLTLPVAVGLQARGLGLPVAQVLGLYLQSFLSNLTLAAVRFIPLGQSAGQRVLSDLAPKISLLTEQLQTASTADLGGAAFGADLAAMAHETQDVRLFRS